MPKVASRRNRRCDHKTRNVGGRMTPRRQGRGTGLPWPTGCGFLPPSPPSRSVAMRLTFALFAVLTLAACGIPFVPFI